MWVNPILFDWEPMVEISTDFTSSRWKRSYELWSHAEQILANSTTELARANVIMDLRRAVDRRVRLLDERYSFRGIPIKKKPSDTLALLEFVGVVRPRMLQKLIAIRNAVEHEDASAPDHETCAVFLEFTWYFLRSTDMIVQRVVDRITFTDTKTGCWVELGINLPQSWLPLLRGWIPSRLISNNPREEWPFLKVKRIETRANELARLQEEESDDTGLGDKTCDRFFEAEVRGSAKAMKRIYTLYFETI
ncbi:MAG: hypothetical protein AABM67_03530 [Acidobacteriota bacterium]